MAQQGQGAQPAGAVRGAAGAAAAAAAVPAVAGMANVPAGAGAGAAAVPLGGQGPQGFLRPAIIPEAYDGSTDWVEHIQYFEQCALVNGWADPQKAQFLAVRLRGQAQRHRARGQ